MTLPRGIRPAILLALAAVPASAQSGLRETPNSVSLMVILGAMALAPFVAIMLTSYVKVSVVLSILRNALGTQQVPTSQVINGLSFIITIFIMAPVAQDMYREMPQTQDSKEVMSFESIRVLYEASTRAKEPLRRFFAQHVHSQDQALFIELGARLQRAAQIREGRARALAPGAQPPATPPAPAPAQVELLDPNDFRVLIPAFVTSELKAAFQAGFVIFLPFLVIDMVVANVLMAMGMAMLQPANVSLPFKLLLFVLADGWYLIVRGLVLSYT